MTTNQLNTLKSLIRGLGSDVRNIQSEDYEALDSMRRTLGAMSDIIADVEIDAMPEHEEALAA